MRGFNIQSDDYAKMVRIVHNHRAVPFCIPEYKRVVMDRGVTIKIALATTMDAQNVETGYRVPIMRVRSGMARKGSK